MIKVAQFIGTCGPGGAESMALNLARKLSEVANIESVVYVRDITNAEWTYTQLQGAAVEVKILPPEVMKHWGVTSMLRFGKAFGKFLQAEEVTHLHSHMYPQILRGALAARKAGIPHIGTLHDVYTLLEKPSRIRWLKIATILGTKLVSVSEDMNKTYHRVGREHWFCKLPRNNPQVVYNGVDTEVFTPHECTGNRSKFNLVSVGRLTDVKNYELLIKAIRYICERTTWTRHDICLTIIGDGEERETLEEMAGRLVPGYVRFMGVRNDIPRHLCQGDVFVLASKSEGLSCSILEAMACGLPILATNVGGNKELVTDNGILVPSEHVDTMAIKIMDMAKRNLLEMGERSLKAVEEKFSLDVMVDNYINLYLGR